MLEEFRNSLKTASNKLKLIASGIQKNGLSAILTVFFRNSLLVPTNARTLPLNRAERLLWNSSTMLRTMQPIISETRVRSQASSCATFGGQSSIGIRFIRISLLFSLSLSFHQCFIIFTCTLLLPEDKRANPWQFSKNNAISEMWEHWIGKYRIPKFLFISSNLIYTYF